MKNFFFSSGLDFESHSEKERYFRMIQELEKLRGFVNKDPQDADFYAYTYLQMCKEKLDGAPLPTSGEVETLLGFLRDGSTPDLKKTPLLRSSSGDLPHLAYG